MDWKELGTKVAQVGAPILGTLVGGPAGAAVGTMIASALGAEPTPEAVSVALSNPDAAVRLREIEARRQVELQQLVVQSEASRLAAETAADATVAGDRADARKMQTLTHSLVPAVLTWFVLSAFVSAMAALFMREVPIANRDILVYMVGQLSGFAAAAVAFWLGTTRDSARKTDLLAQAESVAASR